MNGRTRGYAHRIDVGVGAKEVWSALTSSSALEQWCSPGAVIDARAGGLLRASVDRVTQFESYIDVFTPERRMRLIHLPGKAPPRTESTIVDDLVLDGSGTLTIVRVLGSGIPADERWDVLYLGLRVGWERAMARLKVYVERAAAGERARGAAGRRGGR